MDSGWIRSAIRVKEIGGAHFLFSSLTNTTYPGVHETILTLALRPKLGLWWLNSVLGPILGVLTMLTKLHVTHQIEGVKYFSLLIQFDHGQWCFAQTGIF